MMMKGYTVKEIYVGEFALLDNQENLDRFLEQLMAEGFKIDILQWLQAAYKNPNVVAFVVIIGKYADYNLGLRFFEEEDLKIVDTRRKLRKVLQIPKDTMRLYLVAAGYEC